MPVLRVVAFDEIPKMLVLQGIGLEGEVLVGPQVVDPELLSSRQSPGQAFGRRTGRWPSPPAHKTLPWAASAACGRRTPAAAFASPSRRHRPRRAQLSGTTIAARPFIILNTPQLCCGDGHETDLRSEHAISIDVTIAACKSLCL